MATPTLRDVAASSARRAFGGGIAGAAAMTVQGGVARFYKGIAPALLQG
eukprot:gene5132-43684_t